MKTKRESNWYDKIFKENLEAVTMALVEKVLHIQVAQAEKLQVDLPKTLERKPDQLLQITDTAGKTFILHLEFQVVDEPDMVYRMLEYRALLSRKYKLAVRQYLLFLSDQQPQMATMLQEIHLSFVFELVWLAQVDYTLFLTSSKPDEVVFAVLGNFGMDNPQQAAIRIVERLSQTSGTPLAFEKYLEQLRILANLRKLKPFIEQIMESITKYIKPEDDFLYKKGKLEGKLEVIEKFLKEGVLTIKQIASYFDVSEDLVHSVQESLQKK